MYHLTKRQGLALKLLTNPDDVDLMFGGAKGPGKSFLFCLWVDHWVEWLIHFFGLKPSKTPIPLGFIGRKQGIDFKRTTLETFKRVVPADHYQLREGEIIFQNTAKVYCGGLDDQQRIKKFNSAEFAFIGVDQAEETERNDVDVLQASCRLVVNGKKPPYKRLYTANPADCWLKEDFIDNILPNHHFIPALPSDNPHLPSTYIETLKSSFRHNPALLRAYLDGDWFALKADNALISMQMLNELKGIKVYPKELRKLVVCDPSLGGDECVIYVFYNTEIVESMYLSSERDTMKIAGHMSVLAEKHKTRNYGVDVIGIGQGIADRLREIKEESNVIYINSAEQSIFPDKYYNQRAEMWWYVMTEIQDRRVEFPEDETTRNQLTAMRFTVVDSNGKIKLEIKDKTRQRIGRSPDRADAYVMGIWALQKCVKDVEKDAWKKYKSESGAVESATVSAMAA